MVIGDSISSSRVFTLDDITHFAEVSGDHNPIHLDDNYAATTRFGRRIVHGMLVASSISAIIANQLPGTGSVYLSQTLKFKAPVFPGDEISTEVEVIDIRSDKPIATLRTTCTKIDGTIVIDGEAVVLFSNY